MSNKNKGTSLFQVICFILFVVWAIGTLLSAFGILGSLAGTVELILRVVSLIVLIYSAYLYYASHKSKAVTILFWFSVIVAIVAFILPYVLK